MSHVLANERTLAKRKLTLQRLFRPIVNGTHVNVFQRFFGQDVALGLGTPNFGGELRYARHRTRRPDVFLNYFEVWIPTTVNLQFSLSKLYLHLDEPDQDATDRELLAMHCDPAVDQADRQFRYKRGPHFHVSGHRPNFHKAHIAACLTNLDVVCRDLDSLTDAVAQMIEMIGDEMLERL